MHKYSEIHKYSPLSMYNATCMYIFRVDHFCGLASVFFPGERLFIYSKHSLIAYSSLCKVEIL